MSDRSKLRTDADNAFLRTQTRSLSLERIVSESDMIARDRDANTARLRQQRLDKEALDRETAAVEAAKPKTRARAKSA